MREAAVFARRGTGATYPNPCVGALIVKGGEVVAKGRSSRAGGPHAEVVAIGKAGEAARGADLYVTLEPCSHHGRTPPCTGAILRAGIRRVFVAIKDPNPQVRGKGIAKLRRAGVEVRVGVGEEDARALHEHYLFAQERGRPFVTLKAAVSIDGRIATHNGHSQWITGESARRSAHQLRARHHAIAVGAETLLSDDPALTVRMVKGVDPKVVVFDPRLRCGREGVGPLRALREGSIVLHASDPGVDRVERLRDLGVETVRVGSRRRGAHPQLRIEGALAALAKREIRSLMVEGGGRLLGSFVARDLFEELYLYDAPIILGEGRPVFAWSGPQSVDRAPRLERVRTQVLGQDRLTVYRRRG